MKKLKLTHVIEWPQASGNERVLMYVIDGLSGEMPFELSQNDTKENGQMGKYEVGKSFEVF